MIILLIWVVVLIAVVVLYLRQVYSTFSRHDIKHFKPMPLLGNMGKILLRLDHMAYDLCNLYNSFPDERFVGRFEFINEAVLIRDVELVKKITVKDFEHFLDHRSFGSDSFFGRTLFLLKGQEWKDMRSTLSPAFTSSKIRLMVPFMVEVGDQMIRSIKQKIKNSGDHYIDIETKDITTRYANDVIASCAFGLKVDSQTDENNQFYEMGKTATNFNFRQVIMFFLLINTPKLAKILKWDLVSDTVKNFFTKLVIDTMKDRELRHIIRPDMIHLLMEAKKGKLIHEDVKSNDEAAGFATVEESFVGKKEIIREWTDGDLVAQAFLFFVAGFETVSSSMSFLLYELAVNTDVQERLAQEIREHDAKNGGKFDFNSIQNMIYMDMVTSEVLRLWPPAVAMDRICNKDYNMGKPNEAAKKDFILRKGAGIMIPTFAFHRDPEYFPDPEKFDPERFSEENKHKINVLAYMPFGLGPRNCIGSRFALCELKVMAYQLLRHMEVSPCEKTCIPAKLATDNFNIRLKIMIILLIWVVVLIAVVVLYLRQVYSTFSRHGIKHFKPIPLLGNMGKIMLRLDHMAYDLRNLYNSFPEERFVGRFEFINEAVVIRDVELVKKITVKDFEHFLDHRTFESNSFFGKSLIFMKGQEWKDMRSTLSPAFTSSKIRLMVPFMVEVGDQMILSIKQKIKNSGDNYIDIECKDLTTRYANDVIASCAFGLKADSQTDENNQFYEMGKAALNFSFRQVIMLFVFMLMPKLIKVLKWDMVSEKVKNFFTKLVLETMKDRELHHIIRPDMIHLLMEAKKGKLTHEDMKSNDKAAGFATVEESSVGKKEVTREWTDSDLVAQAFLFFIAGFETVSSSMSFLLYELAINPDVQDRLAQEIRDHDAKNGGKFDFNSIQNMTYLDMVVSEVLRLWPPVVATDRICNKDYNLGKPNESAEKDFILRKGAGIMIPTFAFHRDPEYFPDPEKFDPERFSEENKNQINVLAYMPFGVGPRNCIGSRFALCEVKVMVYQLLRQIELSPCDKTCIPAKLATDNFNIRLKGGHWLRFRLRK